MMRTHRKKNAEQRRHTDRKSELSMRPQRSVRCSSTLAIFEVFESVDVNYSGLVARYLATSRACRCWREFVVVVHASR